MVKKTLLCPPSARDGNFLCKHLLRIYFLRAYSLIFFFTRFVKLSEGRVTFLLDMMRDIASYVESKEYVDISRITYKRLPKVNSLF